MQEPRQIINAQEAAIILSEKYGRPIPVTYIRELRRHKRLQAINEGAKTRTYLFYRSEVEQVKIGHARTRGIRTPRKRVSRQSDKTGQKLPKTLDN